MNFIRKKLFIISYIGNLLLIVAMFIPLIKFNNQTFAFIDQYFYLSFSIIVLVTISLVLIVMKKYKLSLIPTVINVALIVYGIVNILNIEGLKQTSDLTFGSAFILYPISILLILIGNLLVTSNKNGKNNKEKINEINPIDVKIEEPNEIENNDIELNFDEQIPLSQIIERTQNNIPNNYNNDLTNISKPNVINNNPIGDFVELNDVTIDKLDNDNSISINDNVSDQLNNNLNNDFVNDSELNDVIIDKLDNDDIVMDDLDEVSNQPSLEKYNIKNEDLEIPDQSDDNNIMINNIQIEDKPKQEFMAINPFDIKVDEKKPLFKKKEKMEEDPIQKLMKRNIPMTLGRTCQFCNTPLGDDERICPICGRIN